MCKFPECLNTKHFGLGYCNAHYSQLRRGQELRPITLRKNYVVSEGTKQCTRCNKRQSVTEFAPVKAGSTKVRGICYSCKAVDQRIWRANHRESYRGKRRSDYRKYVLVKYGLTEAIFEDLARKQDYKCAICKTTVKGNLHVDHDHISGKIRGLLCGSCNRGIGLLQDNPGRLRDAAKYLEENIC